MNGLANTTCRLRRPDVEAPPRVRAAEVRRPAHNVHGAYDAWPGAGTAAPLFRESEWA